MIVQRRRYRVVFALVALWTVLAAAEAPPAREWPRVVLREGTSITIYQPQLQSWDDPDLQAISVVGIQPRFADPSPPPVTYGTIAFEATTSVDKAERVVVFENLRIASVEFPSAPDQAEGYLALLRQLAPKEVPGISLDRLEASLALLEAQQLGRAQQVKNEAPAIIFAERPSLLIAIEGPPIYQPVAGTKLERLSNTRALILRDDKGRHWLHLFDGYVLAEQGLGGPWTVAKEVPPEVTVAERAAVAAKQVDLLAGQEDPATTRKPSLASQPPPDLYLPTTPTELIVTTGKPQWTAIPTAQLVYIENTVGNVFRHLADQRIYVLISGRWFRAATMDGPWTFVPGSGLPADFAKIPDESPKENVKAAIPGTRQAREALIANQVPNTEKVERDAAIEPVPTYDGEPRLAKIEGTPLQYVVNSAVPVIWIDAKTWYACADSKWFVATGANGPWVLATSVPAVIYSIPPSSPLHYVTYVRIVSANEQTVSFATTPGYYGALVGSDGQVVYGSGYTYAPYVGSTVYVSYPVTYGYGCNPSWTPWAGWAFGFTIGFAFGNSWNYWAGCPPAPYWGPYWGGCYGAHYNPYGGMTAWGPYGWAGTSGHVYTQRGAWSGVSRSGAGYNAWTGNAWASQYGRAYNSTTGTRVAGRQGAVENVYSGNYAYGGRGAFANEAAGVAGAGTRVTVGGGASGKEATLGRATIYDPQSNRVTQVSGISGNDGRIVDVNGQVVASKDGAYYRPNDQGGWDQIDWSGKDSAQRSGTAAAASGTGAAATGGQGATQRSGTAAGTGSGAGAVPAARTGTTTGGTSTATSAATSAAKRQEMDREMQSRLSGANRQQSFERHRPTFSGSSSAGGGYRGGGGRGGGGGGRGGGGRR